MDKPVKCVVFDLDNTIWKGIILENDEVELIENIKGIIEELDNRGILMSIASKGEEKISMEMLNRFGLSKFFLYPQINWESKKNSLLKISELLNIGIDTFSFIDDQEYELKEIAFYLPEVMCINSSFLHDILNYPRFNQNYYTKEAQNRRKLYIADIEYKKDKDIFAERKEEFSSQLNMEIKIRYMEQEDLDRVTELINRTNKLNSSGTRYPGEAVKSIYQNDSYQFWIIDFKDKYCDYGTIGVFLMEKCSELWNVKLLAFSCRMISRDICRTVINTVVAKAKAEKVFLLAEYTETGCNRTVNIMLKSCGFEIVERKGEKTLLNNPFKNIDPIPKYVKVINKV